MKTRVSSIHRGVVSRAHHLIRHPQLSHAEKKIAAMSGTRSGKNGRSWCPGNGCREKRWTRITGSIESLWEERPDGHVDGHGLLVANRQPNGAHRRRLRDARPVIYSGRPGGRTGAKPGRRAEQGLMGRTTPPPKRWRTIALRRRRWLSDSVVWDRAGHSKSIPRLNFTSYKLGTLRRAGGFFRVSGRRRRFFGNHIWCVVTKSVVRFW